MASCLGIVSLVGGFAVTPVQAQTGGLPSGAAPALAPYQVSGIEIDATAENAVKARDKALAQGQVDALRQLMQRLVAPTYYANLPNPSASEVEQMVLGVSIRDEKSSAVRYLAKIDVSFMPQAVQDLLTKASIPFVQGTERPMVVLPIWQASAESPKVLWEEPNPWRQAWSARSGGGLVATAVPLGDLSDLSIIDVDRAEALDERALAAITERYAAEGALVITAVASGLPNSMDPNSLPTLRIQVRQSALSGVAPQSLTVTPQVGETMDQLLQRAVEETTQAIDGEWKTQALSFAGPVTIQGMQAQFGSLDDWLAIRGGLDRVQAVREWSLLTLQRQQAEVQVSFAGTEQELASALSGAGVVLSQGIGGWVLTRGVVAPSYGAPVPASPSAPDMPQDQGAPVEEPLPAPAAGGAALQDDLPHAQGSIVVQ